MDDHSRLAYVEVLADERASTVVAFLHRAGTWFRRRGIEVQRVLSDNSSGKAECFIQTLLRECAYAVPYPTSAQPTAVLTPWLHYYNWHRGHSALGGRPPISRAFAARLSDALLLDPVLSEYPITATVNVPPRRRSPIIADIAGSVASPDLRRAALDVVTRETRESDGGSHRGSDDCESGDGSGHG